MVCRFFSKTVHLGLYRLRSSKEKKNAVVVVSQDNGKTGDLFMNQVEPVTANVPYMTLPGNHEMM